MPVSGFADAPLTKGLLIFSCLLPLFANVLQLKPYAHLQLLPHVLRQGQYWRLVTYQLCYTNSSEVLLSALLLYRSGRTVERIFSTPKYAAFVLFSLVVQAALTIAIILVMMRTSAESWFALAVPTVWRESGRLPGGPFGLIAALVYQHSQLVPDLWLVKLGPVLIGDRALDWVLLMLLCVSQAQGSFLLCVVGIVASALYASHIPVLGQLRWIRIPSFLYRLLAHIGEPWIGSTRLPQRSSRAEPRRRRTRAQRNAERVIREGVNPAAGAGAAAAGGGATGPTDGTDTTAPNNQAAMQMLTGFLRRWSRRQPPPGTGVQTNAGPPSPSPGGGPSVPVRTPDAPR
ncbi:unnamed protein product [Tilletia laevis]|uniref:Peptidase S54 rhomboid domain-containing protein n=2 Tax=Tilletia TaxID=13289 RepID=A0A177UK60_9BASI|nr:hypothetical protein CF336_g2162 [Tilletia laevis]KAE8263457.1 hypothetical protein A4X03_0g1664 [Tilletia caries]KAE8207044.1 hypothetical protein CF335_g1437 [Tilletia laevis]CAD6884301.1 unnamed protein product [Tilletia caries]CAD6933628.1 unnamed protein product [Tilletia laevis]